jgi:uncharacterized membrane protein
MKILKKLWSYLVTGFFVLFPIGVSVFIIWKILQYIVRSTPYLSEQLPTFWIGLLILLLITLITGILAKNYFGKKLIELINAIIVSIPILHKIFRAVQQIMDIVMKPPQDYLGEVVIVESDNEKSWSLGFVMSREASEISEAAGQNVIGVFMPIAPNPTKGILMYVPESKVRKVKIKTEVAMRIIVSSGLISNAKTDNLNLRIRSLGEVLRGWRAHKDMRMSVDPRD